MNNYIKSTSLIIIILSSVISNAQNKRPVGFFQQANKIVKGNIDTSFRDRKCNGIRTFRERGLLDNVEVIVIKKYDFRDDVKCYEPSKNSAMEYFNDFNIMKVGGKLPEYFKPDTVAAAIINIKNSTNFSISFNPGERIVTPSGIQMAQSLESTSKNRMVHVTEFYEIYIRGIGQPSARTNCILYNLADSIPITKFYLGAKELNKDLGLLVPTFYCVTIPD